MAPLPEDNTARLWVSYDDGYNEHSVMFRTSNPLDIEGGISYADQFLAALAPILYEITITGARFATVGTNVSNPVLWTGASTYGTFLMPQELAPRALTFLARSSGGRRARWSVYGLSLPTPANYRITNSEEAAVLAANTVLNAAQNDGWAVTIDGLNPVTYPYADVNFNSYWEAEARE